jgi:mannose-6-phosphate isomerase-like protein (cupin superfamily)
MSDYRIVNADDVGDQYAGSDVPGEFRRLTDALEAEQLSATLIRIPPHSDFEQGTGHFHDDVEELYLVTRGTLTMRFGDEVKSVSAPAAVRVAPKTPRSHRNEGDDPGSGSSSPPCTPSRRRNDDRTAAASAVPRAG